MPKAFLQHISFYLPEKIVSNEDLSNEFPEWSPEKILKKTGVVNRHISAEGETALDMAEKAANLLFDEYGIDRNSIDYLLLCTQSPDYFLPTSACILQDRLHLSERCGALDYNLGCSGYVYGLGLAKGLICSGQASNVLLITSESYSKYLNGMDKSCRTIFGDGAAASLISSQRMSSAMNASIKEFSFRTIGSHYRSLIVENGCSRNPYRGTADVLAEDGSYLRNADNLFMDGKDIFEFSARAVPETLDENLKTNGVSKEEVSLFVFHQANEYMLNFVRMRTKIPAEKFVIDLSETGNTVSSTIPIALRRRVQDSPLSVGQKIAICGFGVGLSVGAGLLEIE